MRSTDTPPDADRPCIPTPSGPEVDVRRVMRLWTPLAASWVLMAMEPTLVIAAISRNLDAKTQLAAWGSVVFPVSLVIEGPIIMMLAASTRLATSWDRYRTVLFYGCVMSALLTVLHAVIAFTPLYDYVAINLFHSNPAVIEPARLGLQIMLPWTFAIGYRRTQQGALIRFERSGAVGVGTLIRLFGTASVLIALTKWSHLDGVVIAAWAVATGVTVEAFYAGWKVREVFPELRRQPAGEPLTVGKFARFYTPLAITPMVMLFVHPIGAASMNRMPRALDAVATWGPVHALVFTARSVGMAFNEVVVTLVALGGGPRSLRRFGLGLAAATSLALGVVWATPLAGLWFGRVQSIPPELLDLATMGAGLCIVMPAYQVAQSWFQGVLVHAETTRPITEAVFLYFVLAWGLMRLGIEHAEGLGISGLAWTLCSFVVAGLSQTFWLWLRSRRAVAELAAE